MIKKGARFDDITGKKFGFVTVKSPACRRKEYGTWVWYWYVDCSSCHKKNVIVSGKMLRRKNRKTCGCKIRLTEKIRIIKALYSRSKRKALDRKYDFYLDIDQFLQLICKQCHYCGGEGKTYKHRNKSFVFNGIDRVNNNYGYSIKNCVPACERCNRMKLEATEYEFFLQVKRIASRKRSM